MEKIGTSSIWIERYRPQTFNDVIVTTAFVNFLESLKKEGETTNILFSGPAGTGKTSIAKAIAKELGADSLYVNASKDRSINDMRYTVEGFATTKSLMSDGLKIVILDEFDRLTPEAMDSLKGMIEETHRQCRYIFVTNNIRMVTEPVTSRAQEFVFGKETGEERKELIVKQFARAKFILEDQGVEYDKKVVATLITKMFPDFRRATNKLHQYNMMYGKIDEGILDTMDDSLVKELIPEMKAMNFNKVQLAARGIDPGQFYRFFYDEMKTHLQSECIPDMIVLLNEYNYRDGLVVDREINLVACLVDLMKGAQWK